MSNLEEYRRRQAMPSKYKWRVHGAAHPSEWAQDISFHRWRWSARLACWWFLRTAKPMPIAAVLPVLRVVRARRFA